MTKDDTKTTQITDSIICITSCDWQRTVGSCSCPVAGTLTTVATLQTTSAVGTSSTTRLSLRCKLASKPSSLRLTSDVAYGLFWETENYGY